ncbi:ADP-ribosylglycohydrolase family protein [Paenibacillus psychroresistens]|uniref:ADP-ribosylglycohydrolase family protein n=1 Tax=Paenibacillus psychroresistens TaxID=1778678 RepID=A0A6B8RX83_9BACL|nr:ADP-ribosylglycohydrolase family protein [Paenibacillus psychroresistens]QGQ99953.1 ADP-ribosylglycohydrolase family protein [Paenibacillus psychroresistens]
MAGWEQLKVLVDMEIIQRSEEGCDVTGFEAKWLNAGEDEAKLMEVYHQLMGLEVKADFPFIEPSDLPGIRALRPEGPRQLTKVKSESEWLNQFDGAWLGRSIGCALGKPLEQGAYMSGSDGRPGWKNVELWFKGADAWPIRGYTPGTSRASEEYGLAVNDWCKKSWKENIQFMESDDDIRYTVLGLILLEEKGLEFDSWDIGKLWHRHLSYQQVCTAETQAYLNFAQVTSHMDWSKPDNWPLKANWVRTWLNPYREWIGAQIRADGFAYGAAGNPELAAELAWRDASFSHVKNGIYGEMFVAAMIAAAFIETDNERIVEIGLSEIPQDSRLAHDVRKAVDIARNATNQLDLVDQIWEAFKQYNCVHTNNNAALVAAALIFAKDDFELAITTAVLGGWDTDCNGATVGSIMGAKLGAAALPAHWTEPLHDTLYAEVNGFHPIAISDCAKRSYEVFKKMSDLSRN